ncbi:hypothetical protein PIB30_037804 [Stylosanthes scabra]|uniref:Uncharacterized protein n=1 Tax=Stylosanthes scabra TaxID=79078 RepID=A0ABU6ZCL7_9FABA|nr:hypothetical protein [Stylosanthes scabra]
MEVAPPSASFPPLLQPPSPITTVNDIVFPFFISSLPCMKKKTPSSPSAEPPSFSKTPPPSLRETSVEGSMAAVVSHQTTVTNLRFFFLSLSFTQAPSPASPSAIINFLRRWYSLKPPEPLADFPFLLSLLVLVTAGVPSPLLTARTAAVVTQKPTTGKDVRTLVPILLIFRYPLSLHAANYRCHRFCMLQNPQRKENTEPNQCKIVTAVVLCAVITGDTLRHYYGNPSHYKYSGDHRKDVVATNPL